MSLPAVPFPVRPACTPLSLYRTALALGAALALPLAGAASLDFGVSAATGGSLPQRVLLRVGVLDAPVAGFTLNAGLGTRGLDAELSRALVLPGVGAVRARVGAAALFTGGLRGTLNLSGTAGPVALTLNASAWNAGLNDTDPLARWTEAAPDLRGSGAALGVAARYRLNRDVVLGASGTLGGQSSVLAQAEVRRGELTYRAGVRAGAGVLGAALGASYTDPETGLSAALDVLSGPDTFGLNASLGLEGALGEGSGARLFAAYEPWRTTSETLRYGVQASRPLGAGTLNLEGYGGTRGTVGQGFGLKLGYLLPLDAPPAQEPEQQQTP